MAKQTVGKRAHHNLDGVVRDLKELRDNGDQKWYEFGELICQCLDDIDELIEPSGGGEDDSGDDATDGDSSEMASGEPAQRVPGKGTAGGPAARSAARGAPASMLDRALDYLAGQERSEAVAELDALRVHSMGAPRVALKVPRGKK